MHSTENENIVPTAATFSRMPSCYAATIIVIETLYSIKLCASGLGLAEGATLEVLHCGTMTYRLSHVMQTLFALPSGLKLDLDGIGAVLCTHHAS